LGDTTRHQILALGRLGWTLSRIQQTTGVRRETISSYLKDAGIPAIWQETGSEIPWRNDGGGGNSTLKSSIS
jgi:hypothetical protein